MKTVMVKKEYFSDTLFKKNAQVYGEELQKIAEIGQLTPESIVNTARDISNPLHECFEWEDSLAAENWRKQQARILINVIKVKVKGISVSAFESVNVMRINVEGTEEHHKEYVDVHTVMSNQGYSEQLIMHALKEIGYWREKHKNLSQLLPIFESIEKVERRVIEEGEITTN